MRPGKITNEDSDIKDILENAKTIAIIGLSPESERESNNVARYLKDQGYSIIPVRPDQEEILGQRVYATLDDINEKVDRESCAWDRCPAGCCGRCVYLVGEQPP